MITSLPVLESDDARTARTRARCHHRLAALRRRIESRQRPSPLALTAERVVIAGLCVVYLIAMAGNILRIG